MRVCFRIVWQMIANGLRGRGCQAVRIAGGLTRSLFPSLGQLILWNQNLDRPGDTKAPLDQSTLFQRQHHLMHGRLAVANVPLHVFFGRGLSVEVCVVVNQGKVLVQCDEIWSFC